MFHFDQGQQFLLSIVSFILFSSSSLDSNSKIFGMEWILVSLGITKFLWLIENWREETIIGVILTIIAEVRIVHKLVEIFFDRRFCDLYGNLIHYHEIFFEFTLLKSAVGIVFSVARFSSKIISTIKRCPILSSSEIPPRSKLNSLRLGAFLAFLMQPVGRGSVMALPYLLFLSDFSILPTIPLSSYSWVSLLLIL